MTVVVPKT